MGPSIVADVIERVNSLPEIDEVNVDMVFDPPWERSMMSEAAQLELGMMGVRRGYKSIFRIITSKRPSQKVMFLARPTNCWRFSKRIN